jgi:hypothetical protein
MKRHEAVTPSRLAIFALLELAADPDRQLSVAGSVKNTVSSHHLAKVMNVLVRAGLVRSVRARGGYQFNGNVRRTTLLCNPAIRNIGADVSAAVGTVPAVTSARSSRRDRIARATLGSITIATMLKLVERRRNSGRRPRI